MACSFLGQGLGRRNIGWGMGSGVSGGCSQAVSPYEMRMRYPYTCFARDRIFMGFYGTKLGVGLLPWTLGRLRVSWLGEGGFFYSGLRLSVIPRW